MPPLVSVIIPTYNRWSYLQMTIDSVLAQTYPNIEIIVIDDGSTDRTAEMLDGYGNRIQVIHQKNQGGTSARNTGVRISKGDYLTFLDHDDLMFPTKLERQIALLEAEPKLGAAHCRWQYIDPQGKTLDKIGPLPKGDIYKTLVLGCFLWSGAPVVRREYFHKVGDFDPSIWSSDWDMWLRLAAAGCIFGCVQEILGAYRIMPDSTMADVSRTEKMDIHLLDKVFANEQQTPQAIQAVKAQAYGTWRFWLSRRYYATGSPQDGERNLAEAIRLYPVLLDDRDSFLETLCNEALDVRVNDPLLFVEAVFNHLPPSAEAIRTEKEFVECQVYLGLALRAYNVGNFDAGQDYLRKASKHKPDFGESFVQRCVAYALRVTDNPETFARIILDSLPSEFIWLRTLQPQILGNIVLASAFEEYFAGRHFQAGWLVLSAVRWQPSYLKNKGVLSVFAKSLPQMLLNKSTRL